MKSSIIRMGSAFALALFSVLLLAPSAGHAQVPRTINYQGSLTDSAGSPVSGPVTMTFRLYNALGATTALWAETRSVTVTNGTFSVVFGEITANPLQDSFFEAPLYLGIAVGGDAEMAPRQALTSAPQAIRAKTVENGIPAGAIWFFDLAACPTGWSELVSTRGRTLVGLPGGGTRGGTLGAALANLENRNHQHDVNPASKSTTPVAAHDHGIHHPSKTTTTVTDHRHTVDPPGTFVGLSPHNHRWSQITSNETWQSYDSDGSLITMMDWGDGMDSAGSGNFPVGVNSTWTGTRSFYTGDITQGFTVNIVAFNSGSNGGHDHTLETRSLTSGSSGAHSHSVDVANTTSTTAGIENVMPYIQFLVCRKN